MYSALSKYDALIISLKQYADHINVHFGLAQWKSDCPGIEPRLLQRSTNALPSEPVEHRKSQNPISKLF